MAREILFTITRKDFRMDTFHAGGPGGQNQNKRDTGVRITHLESGAVGESREERSQLQNRKTAFERCVKSPKFRIWHARKVFELENKARLEVEVERDMHPENLRVEIKVDGRWAAEETAEEAQA